MLAMLLVTCLSSVPGVSAVESIRTQEINECRSNELMTWGDGKDRPVGTPQLKFSYNPTDAPIWFPEKLAAGMVAKAAESWSQCGVPIQMVRWSRGMKPQRDVVLVQWSQKGSCGNFGLANLKERSLLLGPKAFELLKNRNPAYDSRQTLQMVISHEMGHLLGLLAHSRRCVDVMSYYNNGSGEKCYSRDPSYPSGVTEYRYILPTACDIERCRKVNDKPPLPKGVLTSVIAD